MLFDIDRLKKLLDETDLDALLALSPENTFYLCGCSPVEPIPPMFVAVTISREGEGVVLWPIADEATLSPNCWIKDRRFFGTYYIERPVDTESEAKDPIDALFNIFYEMGADKGKIGIEDHFLTLNLYEKLRKRMPRAVLKNASTVFNTLRLIKTEEEIKRIKKVVDVSERALIHAYDVVSEGVTELEVAAELRRSLVSEGARDIFIEFGAGPRSWLPDPAPSEYRIKPGDVIHIDLGTSYRGYCSDISRNAILGEPTEIQNQVHEAVLTGQQRALESIRPGVKIRDIFKVAQNTVRAEGFPKFIRHNMGHGIGLEYHEDPSITATNNMVLEPGMVITIEIPYHIAGVGGYNIEDIILVTKDGYEYITTLDREFYVL